MSGPFEPGTLVVCVDDSERDGLGYFPASPRFVLTQGCLYEVDRCVEFEDEIGGGWGVLLAGEADDGWSAWGADRFRRLRPNERQAREQWSEMLRNPATQGVE